MNETILPTKPIKNEDGTYTLAFPDIIVEDELTANVFQMAITEFVLRLWGGTLKFEGISHYSKKNKEEK